MHWKLKQLIREIKAFFNPRQKWLTKKIPNTWTEYDQLLEICLFEILINFVEKEMDIVDWEWADNHKEAGKRILDTYQYIKVDRPILQKRIDDELTKSSEMSNKHYSIGTTDKGLNVIKFDKGDYETVYGEHDRWEKFIEEKDTEAMKTIIEVRHYLWT